MTVTQVDFILFYFILPLRHLFILLESHLSGQKVEKTEKNVHNTQMNYIEVASDFNLVGSQFSAPLQLHR